MDGGFFVWFIVGIGLPWLLGMFVIVFSVLVTAWVLIGMIEDAWQQRQERQGKVIARTVNAQVEEIVQEFWTEEV